MPKGRPREFDFDKALDAALLLFWRHGYEGTSLSALAEKMQINMPSLYAAFGNKETLFRRALQRYLEKHACYLPNALQETTARGALEKLFAGAINLAMHPRNPDGCLLVQGALAAGPDAQKIQKELSLWRARAEAAVRQRLELAATLRELPPAVDPALLARYVTTVLWGLSVQAAGGATRGELESVARLALQSIPWPGGAPEPGGSLIRGPARDSIDADER